MILMFQEIKESKVLAVAQVSHHLRASLEGKNQACA